MSDTSSSKLIDFTDIKLARMASEADPESLQGQSILMALEMYRSNLVDIRWVNGEPYTMIKELDMLDEIEDMEYGL